MKKLTEKQKSRLWEDRRNVNFQASRRLEGVDVPLITLTPEEVLARIAALRSHYERSIRRGAGPLSLPRA